MNRNVKIGIIVSIVILFGVAGFVLIQKYRENNRFLSVIERNLDSDAKKIFEDRITDLQKKLAETTNNDDKYNIYIELGTYKYALGLLRDSKEYYNEAIKIKPEQYDVYLQLFLTQTDMTDYQGAETSIKKAIDLRKGIADMWKKYIEFEINKLNPSNDEVAALYNSAINDIQTNGDATNLTDIYTSYASWLEKTGNLQGAIDYWNKAITTYPGGKKSYQSEIDRIQRLINQQK